MCHSVIEYEYLFDLMNHNLLRDSTHQEIKPYQFRRRTNLLEFTRRSMSSYLKSTPIWARNRAILWCGHSSIIYSHPASLLMTPYFSQATWRLIVLSLAFDVTTANANDTIFDLPSLRRFPPPACYQFWCTYLLVRWTLSESYGFDILDPTCRQYDELSSKAVRSMHGWNTWVVRLWTKHLMESRRRKSAE